VRLPGPTHLVVGFENRAEAARFLAAFQDRLAKFGLELNSEKTRLIEFGRYAALNRERRGEGKPETFTFLGFTHHCGKRQDGSFIVNHRSFPSSQSKPEARALSSAGITRPPQSYGPLRLPDLPPSFLTAFGAATPSQSRAFLTDPDHLSCMPCSIPRWTGSGARWLASGALPRRVLPCPCSLPRYRGGSASTSLLRGLLKLHTRYGLQGCSPTIRGLYREAPRPL
jgi:hypothetical protein